MCELVRNKMNLMLVLGGYFEQEQGRELCVWWMMTKLSLSHPYHIKLHAPQNWLKWISRNFLARLKWGSRAVDTLMQNCGILCVNYKWLLTYLLLALCWTFYGKWPKCFSLLARSSIRWMVKTNIISDDDSSTFSPSLKIPFYAYNLNRLLITHTCGIKITSENATSYWALLDMYWCWKNNKGLFFILKAKQRSWSNYIIFISEATWHLSVCPTIINPNSNLRGGDRDKLSFQSVTKRWIAREEEYELRTYEWVFTA